MLIFLNVSSKVGSCWICYCSVLNVLHKCYLHLFLSYMSCFVCVQSELTRGWFNLSAQEIQPLYYQTKLEGQGWLRSRGCPDDAWNGGCSLLMDGLIPATCTSPVSAKCVCFLFILTLFSSGLKKELLPLVTP